MKPILTLLLAAAALPAHAQFGAALTFATDTEIGAQVSYYTPLDLADIEGLRVGGDFTLYMPESFGDEVFGTDASLTYFEFNANGHYPFQDEENLRLYALGGLNYSYFSYSGDFGGFASGGDVGLNVGAGAERPAGFGRLFGEVKLTAGGFGQFALLAGVRFGD